ncbi:MULTISPECIES: TRAP transporter large permease [Alphaproteobacteria]|uniref:TRAP transporter large permease protein n=2 Tax=Alphaproteobacteria TaxID=28211 RepID=A0A934TDE9_9RHOB|nr:MULTISPECIES: TRAP transporter large permease [Alphaproteobacteria]MBK1695761.1 TRAP transporter large permease [Rhodovibrio salinarum]MBK5925759.1 permease [Rhodobaculum claviforme]
MIEPLIALGTLLGLIALGAPVFLALGGAGLLGLYMARGEMALFLAPTSVFGQLNSFEMIALPLFILMGFLLSETPVGRDIFHVASVWLNRIRGGLAISSVGACTLFGAVSGVSIAGVASVGKLAVPEMMKRGYSANLAAGSVATAGAIAMLIPPSVPFIVYSAMSGVSVSSLFIGGLIPGLAIAFALSFYIYLRCRLRPDEAPSVEQTVDWRARLLSLGRIWHVVFLVVLVVGTIYSGLATPTEASSFGVIGAAAIAGVVYRVLTLEKLIEIVWNSLRVSATILLIIGCAKIFGDYLNLIRIPQMLASTATSVALPPELVMLLVMLVLIALGTVIDGFSLIVVTTPFLLPIVTTLGYDPLWFGIVLVMNLEIAVVTPPVGLNLYTLKGVVPELSMEQVIASALPFVAIQFLVLLVFVLFPGLSLWLPGLL